MSDKNKKPAIDLAGLTKKYNAAAKKVTDLPEDAKPEVREKAVAAVNEALEALNEGKKNMLVKVKFLKTPTGKFGLGYTKGDTGQVSFLLAEVMEEEGYCAIKENVKVVQSPEETSETTEEIENTEVTDPTQV